MSTNAGWNAVEVLAEPTRRRVYDIVRGSTEPLTREQVAQAADVSSRLATFHLERLLNAGLLSVSFARPQGRAGPGAGRPAKRYAPTPHQLEVTVPPRRYNFVARLLASAIDTAPGDARAEAARRAAIEGQQLGALHRNSRLTRAGAFRAVHHALASFGFEPHRDADRLRLRNCPFHDVVDVAPTLVCPLNRDFVAGVIDGIGAGAHLQACGGGREPDCCVVVTISE